MTQTVANYQNLVTSEHASKPKFQAVIAASVQGAVDLQNFLQSLTAAFDLDTAYWAQLDALGQRIGITRNLNAVAPGVHTQAPPNAAPLSDSNYSAVLHSKAKVNSWDGTIANAAASFSQNFLGSGSNLFMTDGQDMTMQVAISGVVPNLSLQAALLGGYMEIRPAGVLCSYFIPSVAGPLFGFDGNNANISGFDAGVWANQIG